MHESTSPQHNPQKPPHSPGLQRITRREFASISAALMTPLLLPRQLYAQTEESKIRVAAIGHTGRGNFGHGLDTVWNLVPNTHIVGIADANAAGLKAVLQRTNCAAEVGFESYVEMLNQTRPDYVTIAPRFPDQHLEMSLAAIEAGVKGLYLEKPFCRTPAEADQLMSAADAAGVKIAIAHRNRYHPVLQVIDQLLSEGLLGKLLEIRGRGKSDHRGGGQDLWVLGTHVLNLIEYFGGQALGCSAVMLKNGQPVEPTDVIEGDETVGRIAGNELHARYRLESGVVATFDSIANDGTDGNGFGLQLIGSKGVITIRCDRNPLAHFTAGNPFDPDVSPKNSVPITLAGVGETETPEQIQTGASVRNHVVPILDLIDACNTNRAPLCDGHAGRRTVEMVCAVFASHVQGGLEIALPLQQRDNPLDAYRQAPRRQRGAKS